MTFSLLLLAHWIGDFGLQTSQMALGKCVSLKWLFIHVFTYTGAILAFSIFLMPLEDVLVYVGVNFLLHLVTDFFTSKWANVYRKTPRKFYPIIGLDQMIHTLTLYWTLELLDIQLFY